MFCNQCGNWIGDDMEFCPYCGTKQEVLPVIEDIPEVELLPETDCQEYVTAEPQKKKKGLIITLIIIGASVFTLGAGMLAWWLLREPTIYLNDYLSVNFEGYDTVGKAVVEFDIERFNRDYRNTDILQMSVTYQMNEYDGLSNGDEVYVTWECNDEYVSKRYGYNLEYEKEKFTVSGLKDVETFDPFDGIQVVFEGTAPYGIADISGEPKTDEAGELSYDFNQNNDLSNGDKVTLQVSYGTEDNWDAFVERYGMIPSPMKETYEVAGLNEYINSPDELSTKSLKALHVKAKEVFLSRNSYYLNSSASIQDFAYIGNYMLINKDEQAGDCGLCMVYQVQIRNIDGTYDQINDIYWYITFEDVAINPVGDVDVETLYFDTTSSYVYIESDYEDWWYWGRSWQYYGFSTKAEVYDEVKYLNRDKYNIVDNLGAQGQTEEVGIIFSDSSVRKLSESEIKSLTDDQIQYAINEIYARNGYIFKDASKKAFYEKYDWYKPTVKAEDFQMSLFNEIEKQNVEMLQKERDARKG